MARKHLTAEAEQWCREAAILRWKAAAERYPMYVFVLVKKKGNVWTEERI